MRGVSGAPTPPPAEPPPGGQPGARGGGRAPGGEGAGGLLQPLHQPTHRRGLLPHRPYKLDINELFFLISERFLKMCELSKFEF